LPCLDARKRRLAGVEKQVRGEQLEAGVHLGRVPGREIGVGQAVEEEIDQIGPAGDNRRYLLVGIRNLLEANDVGVAGRLRRV